MRKEEGDRGKRRGGWLLEVGPNLLNPFVGAKDGRTLILDIFHNFDFQSNVFIIEFMISICFAVKENTLWLKSVKVFIPA